MTPPPVIDGTIGADEWAGAAEFNAQVSQAAHPTGPHAFYPRRVTWYLGWDDQNLYLASRTPLLENERPKRNARTAVGTDVMFDDTLELWLDPKGRNTGREIASYFQAMVNTLGITYFARLYPSVGAKTDNWVPPWKIAPHVDEQNMDLEIQMPVSGFDLARNRSGDAWGMLLARNFMFQNWNQSPLAYAFPNFGFAVNSCYPLMTLAEATPYVKFHSPLALYDGKAFVSADLINPGSAAQHLKVQLTISQGTTNLFEASKTLELQAKGHLEYAVSEPTTPPIDITRKAVYRYAFTVTSEDGRQEIFHTHFAYDPTADRDWLTMKFPKAPDLAASASFNPVRSLLQTKADVIDFPRRAEAAAARTVVKDAAGKVVAESRAEKQVVSMYNDLVRLPYPLAPGRYQWEASLILTDGSAVPAGTGEFEKKDEAKTFAWWGFKGGNAETVLWPFVKVTAEGGGRVLKAWGKELELDGLALPTQIRVTGNNDKWPAGRTGRPDVLAAPIRLDTVIGGQPAPVKASGKPKVVSVADHRVVLQGEATAGDLTLAAHTAFEQDGAYFVDLTLAPKKAGQGVTVDSLDLAIPVRAAVADFLNAYAHCGYSGYFIAALPTKALSGAAPGRHAVWNPSLCGAPTVTVGDFIPQIWLGNEYRGLLWYADNDRGWTPTDGKHAQQIDRDGDAAILIHHLINVPTEIKEPRTISFVLQPTPQRPLQPGWRMLNTSFSQSFLPWNAMGRNDAAYSAMINLDGPAHYARSREFASKWPGPKAAKPSLVMYLAPHTESSAIMTSIWGDRNYFGGEWEGGTYTPTLNDHTLWWVNRWIEEGGLQGLYHDQFSPHKITSVSCGLAYVLPDGRVQPGFALTTRRNYVMRQHALWLEKGIRPPRTLTHITNGGPLGSYSWVETGVDGEDKQINVNTPLDFADTWPSIRIRAGSLSYNWGITLAWMRLIDTKGMSPAQIAHHTRVYAGHCLMHDAMNAWMFNYDGNWTGNSALLRWGLDDDRVFFWPFWSNRDVVQRTGKEVEVSAWTLPDRLLLCLFNYSKAGPAEATADVDLAKMGVSLPEGAVAADIEQTAGPVTADVRKGRARITASVGPRDYRLIALAAAAK